MEELDIYHIPKFSIDPPLQSHLERRFDLIPPEVLDLVAKTLYEGCTKYGESNWKKISVKDHLNHAYAHINAFTMGVDSGEDDLTHAICRLMFAKYLSL